MSTVDKALLKRCADALTTENTDVLYTDGIIQALKEATAPVCK